MCIDSVCSVFSISFKKSELKTNPDSNHRNIILNFQLGSVHLGHLKYIIYRTQPIEDVGGLIILRNRTETVPWF